MKPAADAVFRAAGVHRVYVVTHAHDVFGLRAATGHTHLLAFSDALHARAVAATLQAYRSRHGAFPNYADAESLQAELECVPAAGRLTDVRVDAVALSDLVARVRGTRLLVSVLCPSNTWRNFRVETSRRGVVDALERAWASDARLSRPRPPDATDACTLRAAAAIVADLLFALFLL